MSNWDLILGHGEFKVPEHFEKYQNESPQSIHYTQTFPYQKGYSDGFKKGFQEATKQSINILERMAKPTEIKLILPAGVPLEIVEKMKKIVQEGIEAGIVLTADKESAK